MFKHAQTNRPTHPNSLWYLGLIQIGFSFSFIAIVSTLILYLTHVLHMAQVDAYALTAGYNALLFVLPLLGGYLSETFGYKQAVAVGTTICVIAIYLVSIHNTTCLYLGLGAFLAGNMLFTPAVYTMVGLCYKKTDRNRESGYTLFYIIMNVGFLIGTTCSDPLISYWGYASVYKTGAYTALFALLCFLFTHHKIQPASKGAMAPKLKHRHSVLVSALIVSLLIVSPICAVLLKHLWLDNVLLWCVLLVAVVSVLKMARNQRDKKVKRGLYAFLILAVVSLSFWALYMLENSMITVFIDSNVKRLILGHLIPASAYMSLNPIFIVIVGLYLSWLWHRLSTQKKNPSLPTKFTYSLLAMGIGYLIFSLGTYLHAPEMRMSSLWVIAGYFFLTTAELLISPIGLSMAGRLAPKGREGTLIGTWQVFTGCSALIAGYISTNVPLPKHATLTSSNPIYMHTFLQLGGWTILCALIVACLIPRIKRLIAIKTGT